MNRSDPVDILLIEDNDSDAELTLRALKQNNLSNKVIRFADGQEALDYLMQPETVKIADKRPNPKLILLDLKLPGISGIEVLQAIKKDPVTSYIPVVVLTSSTQEEDLVKSYQLGVNSFISKPVEFEKFMESVKNIGFYWLLVNKAP
jgi:two-component system response regulator